MSMHRLDACQPCAVAVPVSKTSNCIFVNVLNEVFEYDSTDDQYELSYVKIKSHRVDYATYSIEFNRHFKIKLTKPEIEKIQYSNV